MGMPTTKSIKKFFGWSKSQTQSQSQTQNGRKISQQVEKILKEHNENYNKIIKILLLGSGETGKTTIIKQMKILHVQGFNDDERLACREIIKDNLFECISTLVTQMATLQISLGNKSNLSSWTFIRNMTIAKNKDFTPEYFGHVKRLWEDAGVQKCFNRAAEYLLPDCAKFFLDRVLEIASPSFFPSDQFLLHSRRTTIGIQKIEFEVPIPKKFGGGGPQKFWMFDVGGQKGERRKWIQVFDGIQTVLFMVACNTFDQVLVADEERPINRLQESLNLFQDVWISRFLRYAGFIVFLNKQDLLKDKINAGNNIGQYFPQYYTYSVDPEDGDNNDTYIRTRCFIRDLFHLATDVTPPPTPRKTTTPTVGFQEDHKYKKPPRDHRELFFHFTTATDTNNIKLVFVDVHSMILNQNLREIGFA
ncbi:guanine nucleotide-binding protein G(f) subunit alpha isoform X2 [Folsomia candida]|uniref:guanine nucleotide-binding protein G(f) subunit alpha isoform X2 n=1 Tax=Folsomia candida TaxID=158441 RepID=UPI000B906722|nr:guanine nucleotide-binding protein G(f) subunit alpha isoform X2 [Folsomia candida]